MMAALSDNDIKALFRLCASQTSPAFPVPPACLELASGAGVTLEEKAKVEIETRVIGRKSKGTRTSIFEIASELQLDPKVIERLLPLHLSRWGRVGISEILTTEEFNRLQEIVREGLATQVIQVPEFCQRKKIDVDLFRRLLPAGIDSWEWLGRDRSGIYSLEFYHKVQTELASDLSETTVPTTVSTMSLDSVRPANFIRRLLTDLVKSSTLNGILEGEEYIPKVYIKKRQDALINELQKEGIIAIDALNNERIDNPKQFVEQRVPAARLLDQHFVTAEFVTNIEISVLGEVQKHGWGDVKDTANILTVKEKTIIRTTIVKNHLGIIEIAGMIVSEDLEKQLAEAVREFARQQAEAAWKGRTKSRPTNMILRTQGLSKHLSLNSVTNALPSNLLAFFADKLQPEALSAFSSHVEELCRSHDDAIKSSFIDKFYLRFHLHYKALQGITNVSLRGKLAEDLVEYARESGASAVDKLESGLSDGQDGINFQDFNRKLQGAKTGKPEQQLRDIENSFDQLLNGIRESQLDRPALENRRSKLMVEMNTRLQETKDTSLLLLLVLVLMHAKNNEGILRASGKYVPKLLRELQNTGKLVDDQATLLNSVKTGIVQKKQVEDREMQQLKQMGQQCLD